MNKKNFLMATLSIIIGSLLSPFTIFISNIYYLWGESSYFKGLKQWYSVSTKTYREFYRHGFDTDKINKARSKK